MPYDLCQLSLADWRGKGRCRQWPGRCECVLTKCHEWSHKPQLFAPGLPLHGPGRAGSPVSRLARSAHSRPTSRSADVDHRLQTVVFRPTLSGVTTVPDRPRTPVREASARLPDRFRHPRGMRRRCLPARRRVSEAAVSTAGRPTCPCNRARADGHRAHGRAHGTTCMEHVHPCGAGISPSDIGPLNGRDAANYAGCTRGADVRRLGARRRPCDRQRRQAALRSRAASATRSAHDEGTPRAERETRHHSRPGRHQQRGTRPQSQRPRSTTGSDPPLRQDIGGPVGRQGHGAAGRRAPSDRGGDRHQARPPGAAARDRSGGRRPGPRGRARLPPGRRRGRAVGDRSVAARSRGPRAGGDIWQSWPARSQ